MHRISTIIEFTKIRNTVGDDSVEQKIWSMAELSKHPEQVQDFIIQDWKILLQLWLEYTFCPVKNIFSRIRLFMGS